MKKNRHSSEQIIRILREAESGKRTEEVCREHNISAQTFYRWRKKYGGMQLSDVRKLKSLEHENAELKKLLADELLRRKALEIALEKNI